MAYISALNRDVKTNHISFTNLNIIKGRTTVD